jgi:hypothetical protein
MVERGISEADVEAALNHRIGEPDPGEVGTIWINGYAAANEILRICVQTSDQEFVITVARAG